ncbi:RagB/SusD family nutrient uptake outer membrane protein [Tamlana sp. 2_MG-2023]|uniref:RagB/SusD family nutrient uptake outer membrane protein n=1 Tax=unclassified Tamlana TaxID=2614803 RepID=UPI0026E417D0|nr:MULTISPECIES: RagB/SusD family nutrient uptake outer membrane protein [unclassified Tamlana]MDO6761288.1 RagB/SusD family nutrient uptake outer membrane protein [Tamlana sp. 2_MG-2023]MDO6791771.1 RagB/SusD family nutrient uptake outer membrane protein [Tamlana sp. 1_MG-2023]
MKNINFTQIISALVILLTVNACSEDFLDQTNPNNISTDIFWKDLNDLDLGLNGLYKGWSNANNIKLVDELLRSDLAWGSGFQRPTNSNVFYQQTFNNAALELNQKWAENYKTIFRANQVIEATQNLQGTFDNDEDRDAANLILAQARLLRGYLYFNLYNNYNGGNIPIFDEVPVDEAEFYEPVQDAAVVKAFYMEDLKFAEQNLPLKWEGKDLGRVTAGAAVALIGQTHLYAGEFDQAAIYFKSLINDFGYSLTPNIGSNFTTMDEFNSESILEVSYSMDYKNELGPWDSRDVANTGSYNKKLTGVGGWFNAVAANWLILEYRNDPLDYSDDRNKVIDEDGNEKFRKFSLRTSWSVALVDDPDLGYYGFDTPGQAALFNVNLTAFWRKHTNWDLGAENEDIISPGKVRSAINERLIRLAEIYLQYAECMIELGDVDEAMLYINKVRHRSALQLLGPNGSGEFPSADHDNIMYTAQSLMDHLRFKEYPLELSAEGDGNRNIDLRRWGVKKSRFEELAQRRYAADPFEVTMPDGTKVTRWGSIVKELPAGDPLVNPNWNEFQEASQNYIESEHAYWPMPNSELITNPDLYK